MTQQARQAPVGAVRDQRADEPTLGALVHQLSEEIPQLVRSEIRLAQAEVTEKGKRVGIGAGMFGAAGVLGWFGLGTLIATAVLALAEALPAWAAALIVAIVLFAVAGVLALVGKGRVKEGTPLKPERAMAGAREDVETLKGGRA